MPLNIERNMLAKDELVVTCAEDISLLYLLHNVPHPPTPTPIERSQVREAGYTLSFDQERSIASTLGFLAKMRVDKYHIPAVCVQQISKHELRVLVATNKSSWADGRVILQRTVEGFKTLFSVLSHALPGMSRLVSRMVILADSACSGGPSPTAERDVLDAIVLMCEDSILSRLRLRVGSKDRLKPKMKAVLQNAIESLKSLRPNNPALVNAYSRFDEKSKAVVRLSDAWTKHQTCPRLVDLVIGFRELSQVELLGELMALIPNRSMEPTSRTCLVDTINKVARYWKAARLLHRVAKQSAPFRNASVLGIELSPEAFDPPSIGNYQPSLSKTIVRLRRAHNRNSWDLRQICKFLGVSETDANRKFAHQTLETLKRAKVHAEVQLVAHYELQTYKLPPRAICSSKDACYLCHSFLLSHGKIHVPKCHGRLYPGWRIPILAGNLQLTKRFISKTEETIKSSIATLEARRKKTVYPFPGESTVLTIPTSVSTVNLPIQSQKFDSPDIQVEAERIDKYSNASSPVAEMKEISLQPSSRNQIMTALVADISDQAADAINLAGDLAHTASSSIQSVVHEDEMTEDLRTLQDGDGFDSEVINVGSPASHMVGSIKLEVEFVTTHREAAQSRAKLLRYEIRQMKETDLTSKPESSPLSIIDADNSAVSESYPIQETRSFYIRHGKTILEVIIHGGHGDERSS